MFQNIYQPHVNHLDVDSPEIGFSEICFEKKIGEGTFGEVWRGTCRGKEVAIKKMKKSDSDPKSLEDFKKEIEIMSKIRHPNIVLFLGVCITTNDLYLVSEYLPRGNVETLLHDPNVEISLYRRVRMAKDASLGMNWLHCSKPQFIHRDLKPSNLLIDENGCVKVCDFGLSQVKNHGERLKDKEFAKGTPLWMAPEVMLFKELDEKCDIYSFGIVLWELVTREHPFSRHKSYETFVRAVCKYRERPIIPLDIEPSLGKLIEDCWQHSPSDRPSFEEITNRLDYILIDIAIPDLIGRMFWKEFFLRKEEVSFNEEFFPAFVKYFNLIEIDPELLNEPSKDEYILCLKCLKYLLVKKSRNRAEKSTEVVNLETFGNILSYFGPLDDPKVQDGSLFLQRIKVLLQYPWFHGDITTQEALEKLSGKSGNTFLVRFSSVGGMYTLSVITNSRTIQHQRIKRINGGYSIEGNHYESLEQLLLSKGLSEACYGSKYQFLFNENPPTECGYITK